MFEQLIYECRDCFARSRSKRAPRPGAAGPVKDLDPRDAIPRELWPHYIELLRAGTVVWGCIAQANANLFAPGDRDHPANIIYSCTSAFDDNPGRLADIAHAVFQLKNTTPADPELATIAALITDEFNCAEKEPLPRQLTEGHDVYFACTLVHRSRLPNGILSDSVFPLLVCPQRTPANMILPLRYWPRELAGRWGQLGQLLDRTPLRPPVAPLPPASPGPPPLPAGERAEVISLTPVAVRAIRKLARTHQMPDPYYLSVRVTRTALGFHHRVELAPDWDREREFCIECSGLWVLVDWTEMPFLTGSVIDYRDSIYGSGFLVRNPNAP
jgi:Fe-S cluster assembly iron-binding protein IscA